MSMHLPTSIWALGLSGFCLNFASVIVFGCTPILLIHYFKFQDVDAGILEGTVEGFALIIRALAGMLSDFVGKRKAFLLWGYTISTFSRFLLALANVTPMVVASRFIEKLGNGFHASPREAFISDITPKSLLGQAYGLNKTLSMAGSFAGSFVMLLIFYYQRDFNARLLLWGASVMSALSIFILFYGVKEPPHLPHASARTFITWKQKYNLILEDISQFPAIFWKMLGVIFLFKLGYFSGTFMMCLLRNSKASFFGTSLYGEQGLSNAVFLLVQNLSCTLFAYPLGRISDKIDRRFVVAIGFIFMLISLLCFGGSNSSKAVYAGTIFYGMQLSIQGVLMALLSTTMPSHLHGTGFGIFFIVSGTGVMLTNQFFMRNLVKMYGHPTAFFSICFFVFIALVLLLCMPLSKRRSASTQGS